ncbi:MAG: M56 family metallopeptidase [Taibaiella sp.]|jgi:beta-lactamase regulating signal transducer with metallopeptidase domain
MASVISVFSGEIISALCSMIVHSLWQGGLLAACVGLVLIFTRNKSSAYRYNLLVTSLALFSITTLYTFISSIIHLTSPAISNIQDSGKATPFMIGKETMQIMQTSFMDKVVMYLNANSVFIVCVWFIVVCLRSLQLAMGMRSIFLLRYRETIPADSYWQFRVKELSARMGITSAIRIMESGMAKVPMVIGHLKPLILIPLGMLASLPQAELEAILIHELALIRRRDYLVNILQSLLEIIFFFNPAVLWTSSLIKKEREHCCDDITIATASSKVVYIKALVACQEYVHEQPNYAMALNGEKKHLLSRVKRLAINDRKPITYMEKSILAACILTVALLITFFSYGGKEKNTKTTTTTTHTISVVHNDSETIPVADSKDTGIKIYKPADVGNGTSMKYISNGRNAYLLKENDILYQLFMEGGRADALYVNGKEIPAGRLLDYSATINKLMMLYDSEDEATEAEEITSVPEVHQEPDTTYVKPLVSDVKACIALPVDTNIATPVNIVTPINIAPTNEKRPVAIDVKTINPVKPINRIKSIHPVRRANSVKPVNPVALKKQYAYQSKELIADMINDHIIAGESSTLSFKLSSGEFVVNGIKQPEPVYSKYKSKYIKTAGHREISWYYNYDTSSESQKPSRNI